MPGVMPKSRRLAAGESKLCTSKERRAEALDYTGLLSRALRAIRCANVRSGILPPQPGFRRNDELGRGLAAGESKLCTSMHKEQRRWIPGSACGGPGMTEDRKTIRTMRIEPPRPVPSLLVTFGQCQK